MKAIVSAVLALSVLAGIASVPAKADYDSRFGTSGWWAERDRNIN